MFAIGATVAVIACIIGYLGLREYIYGDDAPSIPLLDGHGR